MASDKEQQGTAGAPATQPTQSAQSKAMKDSPEKRSPDQPLARSRGTQSLRRFRDEMDALFSQFFGNWPLATDMDWPRERAWDTDVDEQDKEIVVRAETPGFDPKEFDVQISGNNLIITAEHKEEARENEGRRYAERRFWRSIPLSSPIDADKVEARYRNGILEVHLPRTEAASTRAIEVKS